MATNRGYCQVCGVRKATRESRAAYFQVCAKCDAPAPELEATKRALIGDFRLLGIAPTRQTVRYMLESTDIPTAHVNALIAYWADLPDAPETLPAPAPCLCEDESHFGLGPTLKDHDYARVPSTATVQTARGSFPMCNGCAVSHVQPLTRQYR